MRANARGNTLECPRVSPAPLLKSEWTDSTRKTSSVRVSWKGPPHWVCRVRSRKRGVGGSIGEGASQPGDTPTLLPSNLSAPGHMFKFPLFSLFETGLSYVVQAGLELAPSQPGITGPCHALGCPLEILQTPTSQSSGQMAFLHLKA